MSISFNGNDYGITKKEWRAIKKELKAADKKNDNYDLSKADFKEIKTHIATGDLGAYLDRVGSDMRRDLGLALTGKVDGSEDIKAAQSIVTNVDLAARPDGKPTDKAKVMQYIAAANVPQIAASFREASLNIENVGTASHIATDAKNSPFADVFS